MKSTKKNNDLYSDYNSYGVCVSLISPTINGLFWLEGFAAATANLSDYSFYRERISEVDDLQELNEHVY